MPERAAAMDPRFIWLQENAETYGRGAKGQLFLACPFKSGHSIESGPTETAYFPAATGGYHSGHYHCFHATCAGRATAEFDLALGYEASSTVGLSEDHQVHTRACARVLDPSQCMSSARFALKDIFSQEEKPTLVRSCGAWFHFQGRCFAEVSEEEVRSTLWRYLDDATRIDKLGREVAFKPTQAQITNTADALKAVVPYARPETPSWLSAGNKPDATEFVSLRDGLFHIPSRMLLPHDPAYFSLNSLPFSAPQPGKKPDLFLRFLDQIWPNDTEAQETLQEIFGYLITGDTSQQKMFLIVGPRRSGKGTISRVVAALLGSMNVVGPTLSSLTSNFGLQPLIGKLAAIIPDARIGAGGNTSAVVERLLMLSGEDTISIDRKNREAWTGKLLARVLMMTNELPRLGDASGALPGRFITLSMSRSFYGKEDPSLTTRLLRELPEIFGWALEGRKRLLQRGHFVQPSSGRDLAEELADLGSPISVFVREQCSLVPEAQEAVDDLFEAWRSWCAANGHFPGSKSTFSKLLGAAFPRLRRIQPRGENGQQKRSFGGIKLEGAE